jgi:anti-sigma regulatory factor (Ser/Thr protein kinase)
MGTTSLAPVAVTEASQVGQARRAAVRLTEGSKFPEKARGRVAVIATELATNLLRYGRNGRLFLQSVQSSDRTYVELLAIDSGPGIPDVHLSMQDGMSTGGTPGTGLGAVRRMSDDFDIYSALGHGTLVLARVNARHRQGPPPAYQWAAISTAAPGETVCGDVWRAAEEEDGFAVMVADGLGHGPFAFEASNRAAALFDESPHSAAGPAAFCTRAHQLLVGSRGAALAIANVSLSGRVRYAGIGNIAGALVGDTRSQGLASQNGTVGVVARTALEFNYDWPERGVLIMHSDGLSSRWSLDAHSGLAARHPALIAGVLYRDCLRGRDDATIVVVKKSGRKAAKP